jgi:flagellar basal body rod protein FlgG
LGTFAVRKFADPSQLIPHPGGMFVPNQNARPEPVENVDLLQGYLEGSNVTPMREMVDLVLISRAYEANQKIISSVDQRLQKALETLG